MRKLITLVLCLILVLSVFAVPVSADNPTVQTNFTPDPAPMVYDGVFYFYTGNDREGASFFEMTEWRCYSTTDMQNFTDHGGVLSWEDFVWAEKDSCWAAQCIERNGKFYLYVTLTVNERYSSVFGGGRAIGVGVSDSPTGPFVDALGKPLFGGNWDYIDPTVLIDDDGQAYLYWGNPKLYWCKLKEDMIHPDGEVQVTEMTGEAFGSNENMSCIYTEGPWIYKRGDLYYMIYAASGVPETIDYATSKSPTGPWTYGGRIMDQCPTSFTIHPGVVEYEGRAYFSYHTGELPGGGGFSRSGALEEFTFGEDGSIPHIEPTSTGPEQIRYFNPYNKTEAETMAWSEGIKTDVSETVGLYVTKLSAGDYWKVSGVQFSKGATKFTASVSAPMNEGIIELRLDSVDGELIGSITVPVTGDVDAWQEVSCDISGAEGVHDLYFVPKYEVTNKKSINMNWWQFEGESDPADYPEPDAVESLPSITTPDGGSDGNMVAIIVPIAAAVVCAIVAIIVAVTRKKKA